MPTWANNRLPLLVAGGVLLLSGVLVFLHVQTQDYGARREAELLSRLLNAKAIDSRWDMAVADARGEMRPRVSVQSTDVPDIHAALDAAAKEIPTRVMQATVRELKSAYAEKADLVTRFVQANSDARQALAAAMRADAAIGTQVRAAWREFPQRERLVAAENLVARTLAEAQAYSRAPTDEHRAMLQVHAVDLSRAQELPRAIQATLARLETDIHQVLLLKPLEQTIGARLAALGTGGYLHELTALVQRKQLDGATARAQYRVYLLLYLLLLAVCGGYLAIRAIDRYRALEAKQMQTEIALAEALRKLEQGEERASGRPATVDARAEVVDMVVKPYRVR